MRNSFWIRLTVQRLLSAFDTYCQRWLTFLRMILQTRHCNYYSSSIQRNSLASRDQGRLRFMRLTLVSVRLTTSASGRSAGLSRISAGNHRRSWKLLGTLVFLQLWQLDWRFVLWSRLLPAVDSLVSIGVAYHKRELEAWSTCFLVYRCQPFD